MKIDRVLFCLNNNVIYADFWNINSKIWYSKYGIKPTLFFVGTNEELNKLNLSKEYGEIYLLPEINSNINHKHFRDWKVTWSLFYGATLFPDDICITSGIDQIPLGQHIIKLVSDYSEDKYLVCFSEAYKRDDLFPSSHHVAKGKYYKKIYDISDNWETEIKKLDSLKNKFTSLPNDYWGLDESYSSDILVKNKNNNIVFVKNFFSEWAEKRIDRSQRCDMYDKQLIKNGYYTELHSPRPYLQNKLIIDQIIFDCHSI